MDALSESIIAAHRWMVRAVVASRTGFCYTIGLHNLGLPELIMFGTSQQLGAHLLNDVAHCMEKALADNTVFLGKQSMENWELPLYLLPVSEELVKDYACAAIHRSEGKATYVQVCLPDPNGVFPWEAGFNEDFRQKVNALSAPH